MIFCLFIQKKNLLIIFSFFLFLGIIFSGIIFDSTFVSAQENFDCPVVGEPVEPPPPIISPALSEGVRDIFNYSIILSGIITFAALVLGGFYYLTSAGNPNKIIQAREQITGALIGLVVIFSCFWILRTISPELIIIQPAIPGIGPPPPRLPEIIPEKPFLVAEEIPFGKLIDEKAVPSEFDKLLGDTVSPEEVRNQEYEGLIAEPRLNRIKDIVEEIEVISEEVKSFSLIINILTEFASCGYCINWPPPPFCCLGWDCDCLDHIEGEIPPITHLTERRLGQEEVFGIRLRYISDPLSFIRIPIEQYQKQLRKRVFWLEYWHIRLDKEITKNTETLIWYKVRTEYLQKKLTEFGDVRGGGKQGSLKQRLEQLKQEILEESGLKRPEQNQAIKEQRTLALASGKTKNPITSNPGLEDLSGIISEQASATISQALEVLNQIKQELPVGLLDMPEIKELERTLNDLKDLPTKIESLKNLPDTIQGLSNIMKITDLPKMLKSIEEMPAKISGAIENLPEIGEALEALKNIGNLEGIKQSIQGLKNLTEELSDAPELIRSISSKIVNWPPPIGFAFAAPDVANLMGKIDELLKLPEQIAELVTLPETIKTLLEVPDALTNLNELAEIIKDIEGIFEITKILEEIGGIADKLEELTKIPDALSAIAELPDLIGRIEELLKTIRETISPLCKQDLIDNMQGLEEILKNRVQGIIAQAGQDLKAKLEQELKKAAQPHLENLNDKIEEVFGIEIEPEALFKLLTERPRVRPGLKEGIDELKNARTMIRECFGFREEEFFNLIHYDEFWKTKQILEERVKLVEEIKIKRYWDELRIIVDPAALYCKQTLIAPMGRTPGPEELEEFDLNEEPRAISIEASLPVGTIIDETIEISEEMKREMEKISQALWPSKVAAWRLAHLPDEYSCRNCHCDCDLDVDLFDVDCEVERCHGNFDALHQRIDIPTLIIMGSHPIINNAKQEIDKLLPRAYNIVKSEQEFVESPTIVIEIKEDGVVIDEITVPINLNELRGNLAGCVNTEQEWEMVLRGERDVMKNVLICDEAVFGKTEPEVFFCHEFDYFCGISKF